MSMTNPLITIIVPIYGTERYLIRCLDSIVNQRYQNLEVILVDDGTPDNAGKIADTYAKNDKRFHVIHQSNGGLSDARNRGLAKMTGEYVTFIDSDDYVSPDYVSFMYNLLAKDHFHSKLAMCSLMDVYDSTGRQLDCGDGSERVLSGKQCIEMMCYHDLVDTAAYAKLGHRSLYKDFQFPKGKLFEDIGSTYQLFLRASRVVAGFSPKYYYVIRAGSIVTTGFNESKLDLLEMTDRMAQGVLKKYPDLRPAVLRRQVYARFSTLNQTLHDHRLATKKIQQQLLSYIKKYKKTVLSDPKTPKRDRLAYLMLCFGLPEYRLMWFLYVLFRCV